MDEVEADDVGSALAVEAGGSAMAGERGDAEMRPADRDLMKRLKRTIRADKAKWEKKAFPRMQRDMRVAMHGYDDKEWSESSYKANITGRHVRNKTAALYAKNPKAVARRVEKLDFQIWDESQQSLLMAMQTMQAAQAAASPQPTVDPATGAPLGPAPEPEIPPGFEQAQALLADFQQGMAARMQANRVAKTLEKLFAHAMREQQPLDFKRSMKQLVRRACTTGVGYVEVGFQRATGAAPATEYRLTDARARMEHLQALMAEAEEGDTSFDGEVAEVEAMIAAIQAEPDIVISEGLIFDFPQSTKVIPDSLTRSLVGFVGAGHVTVEYLFTPKQVQEMFGVDLKRSKYKEYNADGKSADGPEQSDMFMGGDGSDKSGLACVWKYYDKAAGLVYYMCDGHEGWLREPGPPDVYVDGFFPVFALTFNECESEDELFPPSDVSLILDIQKEYNRSRDGKREHRKAARPRWVYPKGAFEEADLGWLAASSAFTATGIKMDPSRKISEILQPLPVPGVDPNLYDVNEIMADLQFVVGSSSAALGVPGKGTATANSIAAGASATTDGSSVDDLDGFLTAVTRAAGQILLREMSAETVTRVVGAGAAWPDMTLQDIADEIFLEIEAGSTGKPNQQVEIANMEKILPFLIQMPGLDQNWLARQVLGRLDDRLDLTEAFVDGLPSVVAQNRSSQPQPGDPANQPTAQGHNGAANGPAAPGGPVGRGAPMGARQAPAQS